MLTQVADGVLVHRSELLANNAVVVRGRAGVLVVDPGLTADEMACLATDLHELGQPVVAGFATHPDWDHVLWHVHTRIELDRAYVRALRDGIDPVDPRIDSPEPGWEWVADIHAGQAAAHTLRR
jgi:glyoxylase-like metal-dependent hydrolase (beta-lactamase superfamily II)